MKAEKLERVNETILKLNESNQAQFYSLDNFFDFFKKGKSNNINIDSDNLSKPSHNFDKKSFKKKYLKKRSSNSYKKTRGIGKKIEFVDLIDYQECAKTSDFYTPPLSKKTTARKSNYYEEINLISPQSEKETEEYHDLTNWTTLIQQIRGEKEIKNINNLTYQTKQFKIHSSNPQSYADIIWTNEVDSENLPEWKVDIFYVVCNKLRDMGH